MKFKLCTLCFVSVLCLSTNEKKTFLVASSHIGLCCFDVSKSICWWTFLFSREGTPIPYPNNRISTARAEKNLHFSSPYNKWKHDYYSAGCFSPDLKMGNKGWFKNIYSPIFPRELLFFTKKIPKRWYTRPCKTECMIGTGWLGWPGWPAWTRWPGWGIYHHIWNEWVIRISKI